MKAVEQAHQRTRDLIVVEVTLRGAVPVTEQSSIGGIGGRPSVLTGTLFSISLVVEVDDVVVSACDSCRRGRGVVRRAAHRVERIRTKALGRLQVDRSRFTAKKNRGPHSGRPLFGRGKFGARPKRNGARPARNGACPKKRRAIVEKKIRAV